MSFYQHNFPHWQSEEAEYFIIFRLTGLLSKAVVKKLENLCGERSKKLEGAGSDKLSDLYKNIQREVF